MQAHTLVNPSTDKFRDVQKSVNPNFLYVQGELHGDEGRIGSVVWPDKDLSDPTEFSSLIGSSLPTIVRAGILILVALTHYYRTLSYIHILIDLSFSGLFGSSQ